MFYEWKKKRRILLIVNYYFSGPTRAQGHAMSKRKRDSVATPVGSEFDSEVIAFRQSFDDSSPLDGLVRQGARRMLQ